MNNKIDLAIICAKFSQEWPRYSVGMIATVGLKRAIHAASFLFRMKSVFPDTYAEDSLAVLGVTPSTALRIQLGLHTGIASLAIILFTANSLALRGAIKRNPRNIRTAFMMWAIQGVVLYVPTLLYIFVNVRGEEMADWDLVNYFGNGLALSLLDGWSMFVYMRDMKGQKRDSYGFLVEDKEKADLEKGPLDES
ncbi:hypothetical protein BGX24_003794 [Mortierella sp. AD032]|nr:hypothetical protein BGX24_003794 [Mortierella sp. AD032]